MSRENLHRRENSKSRTSMREKLVEKQKATDEHESNFTAGRVNVRERYLHRTGIRGRKSWIFYAVLYILALIVIVNIVMLAILYHVLQMSKDGMKCLSFFENDNVRFHCISDLDSVNLYANQTGTFKDHNLVIDSDDEKVIFHGGPTTAAAQMHVGADITEIHAKHGFRFVDPYEKKTILNLNGSVWYVNPASINAFTVAGDALVTHRVVSNEDQNLMLTSEQEILVEGHEGLGLDGKMIHINADEDVEISSTSGVQGNSLFKIMLDAGSGVHVAGSALDMVMPTGAPGSVLGKHKLCACINTGKLYRVAVVNTTFSTCSTVKNVCG